MNNPQPEEDLVTQTFQHMRQHAKDQGFKPPSLLRPVRSNVDLTGTKFAAGAGAADAGAAVDADAAAKPEKPQVKDVRGMPIPERLLRNRGVKVPVRKERRPALLGDIFAQQAKERHWRRNIAHGAIMTRWPAIVGDVLAANTEVREFSDGVLVVECASTAWATQLRLMQSEILSKIAVEVGDGVIDQLRILGPKAPSWRKGRLHIKGRGPRDTYG